MNLFRLLFPWNIKKNGSLDKIADSVDTEILPPIYETAQSSGTVRDPRRCANYNALARDFGVEQFGNGDIELYRERLASNVYKNLLANGKKMTASDTDIEEILHSAGFNGTRVRTNNTIQSMAQFTAIDPLCFCGSPTAYIGSPVAVVGSTGYEMIANGKLYNASGVEVFHPVRDEGVFIVCGDYTLNPDGSIATVTELEIGAEYEQLFKRLILRTKPVYSLAVLVVTYVQSDIIAQTGIGDIPTIAQTGDVTLPLIAQGY